MEAQALRSGPGDTSDTANKKRFHDELQVIRALCEISFDFREKYK